MRGVSAEEQRKKRERKIELWTSFTEAALVDTLFCNVSHDLRPQNTATTYYHPIGALSTVSIMVPCKVLEALRLATCRAKIHTPMQPTHAAVAAR